MKKLTAKQQKQLDEGTDALNTLHVMLGFDPTPRTVTVYTILRHCSKSGMSRDISLLFIGANGEVSNITWHAAKVMGAKCVQRDGCNVIRVGGAGMDMGFKLVYDLSRKLYWDQELTRESKADAGYVLRHEWL